jgi:hypothetical protein
VAIEICKTSPFDTPSQIPVENHIQHDYAFDTLNTSVELKDIMRLAVGSKLYLRNGKEKDGVWRRLQIPSPNAASMT